MSAQIVLENVGVRFPQRVLFSGVNWTLYNGTRLTLAGRNGSGKSTLLKIMAGQLEPSEGTCTIVGGKRLKIGYLDQSLLDSAVADALAKKASSTPLSYLLDHFGDAEDAPEQWEIERMLSGLGFADDTADKTLSQLSGGWLLRVFIAASLLRKPDVLLLDEPTNHLDLGSIQWLEEFLQKEYRGSLVMVTHDVALQKRATDSLAVIHGGRFFFRQNQNDYLSFLESVSGESVHLQKQIESTEKKIQEHMEFVMKFRAKAQTAARAQSRLRMAQDLEAERDAMKEQLALLQGSAYSLRLRFRPSSEGSKFPISVQDLGFHYPGSEMQILKHVSFDVKRHQRVAIIGENGAGKTTLLNLIAKRLQPLEGQVQQGYGIEMGYFGQHQLDELNMEDSVFDNLKAKADGFSYEGVRAALGAFGFSSNHEIEKKAKVLSGGERARLALLRVLVTRANLLLLDEPTNHLDIETKELLKKAILEFEGTTLFVSHDREFIRGIADRILFVSHAHHLIDHIGTLDTFMEKYPEAFQHLEGKTTSKPKEDFVEEKSGGDAHEERKRIRNLIKSSENRIAKLEKEIHDLGEKKSGIEKEIEDPEFYANSTPESQQAKFATLGDLDKSLLSKMSEWERLSTELEKLKKSAEN